jgi:hypothetical protein
MNTVLVPLRAVLRTGQLPPQVFHWVLLPQSGSSEMANLVYPIVTDGHCALRTNLLFSSHASMPTQSVELLLCLYRNR